MMKVLRGSCLVASGVKEKDVSSFLQEWDRIGAELISVERIGIKNPRYRVLAFLPNGPNHSFALTHRSKGIHNLGQGKLVRSETGAVRFVPERYPYPDAQEVGRGSSRVTMYTDRDGRVHFSFLIPGTHYRWLHWIVDPRRIGPRQLPSGFFQWDLGLPQRRLSLLASFALAKDTGRCLTLHMQDQYGKFHELPVEKRVAKVLGLRDCNPRDERR